MDKQSVFPLYTYKTLIDVLRERTLYQPNQVVYTFLLDGEFDVSTLTYLELDQRARAIATLLQKNIGQPGERVLLLYPPGLEYICAFLGCLYAGMIAVPSYPPRLNRPDARLQTIAQDAQARVALTTPQIISSIGQRLTNTPDLASICWLTTQDLDIGQAEEWKIPALTGNALAFIQYTSGSTAQPKGVMVSHRNLVHNLKQISQFFGVNHHSRGVIWLPPYHDMGLIGGILEPLYANIPTVLMPPTAFLQKPICWLQAISQYRGTISGAPNFAYDFCAQKITDEQKKGLDLSSWEVAFTGAEPVQKDTLERFATTFEPYGLRREALYPCYGLAEATLIASGGAQGKWPAIRTFAGDELTKNRAVLAALDEKNPRELVSCGSASPEQKLLIVDPQSFQPCPQNQVGEIWLAGSSVAQGYWNRPDESAATFQAHLAGSSEGPFMRTGDLGFLHDGEIYIAGRAKDLIIIRGRNHYPQDIEITVESSHAALAPSSAAAFSVEVEGEEKLVIVQELDRHARPEEAPAIIAAIRQAVVEQHELQVYTVVLIRVGTIPRTSSFKIQRRACRNQFLDGSLTVIASDTLETQPAPETPQRQENLIGAALDAIQDPAARQTLLTIYLQEQAAAILHISAAQVDLQQPLNAFGLDSMMAIELKFAIETALRVSLPMEDFLQGNSVSELATRILDRKRDIVAVTSISLASASESSSDAALSHGQQALWFLYQLAPKSAAYNVPAAVRIRSALDGTALRRAFEKLVIRHAALRTTFVVAPLSSTPAQRIHAQMALDFEQVNALAWDDATLKQRLDDDAHSPFDLEQGPLLRVRIFKRSENDYILLIVMHHIITDFWSLAVLVDELSRLYPAECASRPIQLPPPGSQYVDYANQQAKMLAGLEGAQLWAYWQEQLSGELPVLNLPSDHLRPPVQTYNGNLHTVHLNPELTTQIKALSQAQGTTLNMTLLAAFDVLLYRYTGQQDFLVGSLAVGRDRANLADVVGYFVNPIVLRAKPAPDQTFAEFLAQTRQTVLGAFDHQEYPFNLLVNQLQPVRDYSRSPLFQVMFTFQRAYKFNDQGLTAFSLDIGEAHMDLAGLQVGIHALGAPRGPVRSDPDNGGGGR